MNWIFVIKLNLHKFTYCFKFGFPEKKDISNLHIIMMVDSLLFFYRQKSKTIIVC